MTGCILTEVAQHCPVPGLFQWVAFVLESVVQIVDVCRWSVENAALKSAFMLRISCLMLTYLFEVVVTAAKQL